MDSFEGAWAFHAGSSSSGSSTVETIMHIAESESVAVLARVLFTKALLCLSAHSALYS